MTLPQPSPLWLAFVPVLLAAGMWAVKDVQRFVLFGVLSAMIIPEAIIRPGGTQVAAADLLLLVALGVWLFTGSVGTGAHLWISGNRLLLPTLLFVAVNAESILWSVRPNDTVRFSIQLLEIAVVIPLVFASVPKSVDVIRQGFMLFIGITCLLAALYVPYSGAFATAYLPEGLNKNTVGSFLAAGLVLAYALWLGERRPHMRIRLGLATLLELVGLLATYSRGAIIGGIVAMIAVSMLLRRHRMITFAIAASAATLFVAINGLDSGADLSIEGSYDSSVVRVYSYANAVDKIQEKPLLGSGGGTYLDYIPELGITLPDPNNMVLLTLAELGIVGLLALLFLFWRLGQLLFQARHLPDGSAFLAVGAGCAAISMFVHFQFDVTWTRGTASLAFAMMGLVIAIQRLSAAGVRQPASRPEADPALVARAPVGVA